MKQTTQMDFKSSIEAAVKERAIRAFIIHWLAAMAAISASTYKVITIHFLMI